MKKAVFSALVLSAAVVSQAGDIIANYNFDLMQQVSFVYNSTAQSPNTARYNATRTGGTTTLLPGPGYFFNAYCVEVGEVINPGVQTHANVTPLLGSTTISGGITGPITFDAVKTDRLERLWGTYYPTIGANQPASAAFQLAHWAICFDSDLDLSSGIMTSADAVAPAAQALLNNVGSGAANQRQALLLLSGQGIQDLVTPVPEPASMFALGLGAAVVLRRRRK